MITLEASLRPGALPRQVARWVVEAGDSPVPGPHLALVGVEHHVRLPDAGRVVKLPPVGPPTVEVRQVRRLQGTPQGVGAAPRRPAMPTGP